MNKDIEVISGGDVTDSMMTYEPNKVFVVDSVRVAANRPDRRMIAGCNIPGKGTFQVLFHLGRECWHFVREYKDPVYVATTLHEAIAMFEDHVGVTLPPISMTVYGVGIYDAREKYQNNNNPWQFEDGKSYQVRDDRLGSLRTFVARDEGHGIALSWVNADTGEPEQESFDPKTTFSVRQWEYLRIKEFSGEKLENQSASPAQHKPR